MKCAVLFLLPIFIPLCSLGQIAVSNDNVIINKIRKAYSTCNTYSDNGTMTIQSPRRAEEKFAIKTAFVRPDSFRLEVTSKKDRIDQVIQSIIHQSTPGKALIWQRFGTRPSTLDTISLDHAIARVAPLGYAASSFIQKLLLPNHTNWISYFDEPERLERLEEEVIFADTCYQFRHYYDLQKDSVTIEKLKNADDYTLRAHASKQLTFETFLWFRKSDFLLVKYERTQQTPNSSTTYTWDVFPQINTPIPASELQFNLPPEKN